MNALTVTPDMGKIMEQVVIGGDLSILQPQQRVSYYNQVCQSVGLNPLTRPFEFIKLNGKLTLYARRDAADQLRKLNGISLGKPSITYADDLVVVTIDAVDRSGRTDQDMGAVSTAGLKGEAKANAMMKAITKAKRRVTLSISGLGWLDETEVETIESAQPVVVTETGEIVNGNHSAERHQQKYDQEAAAEWDETHLDGWLIECKRMHLDPTARPASSKAYGYVCSLVDEIAGEHAHTAIFKAMTGAAIDGLNPISDILARALINWIAKTTKDKATGEIVSKPYDKTVVGYVYRLAARISGQQEPLPSGK